MKLANALTERSDIQRRLSELQTRLSNNSKVQEGDKPSEDPNALLAELDSLTTRLEELITKINETNSKTVINGQSLTAMLSKRDVLEKKLSILRGFLEEASRKVDRYSRTEIKIVSTVDVKPLQKTVDDLSRELRVLDETIQEANWTTEL